MDRAAKKGDIYYIAPRSSSSRCAEINRVITFLCFYEPLSFLEGPNAKTAGRRYGYRDMPVLFEK